MNDTALDASRRSAASSPVRQLCRSLALLFVSALLIAACGDDAADGDGGGGGGKKTAGDVIRVESEADTIEADQSVEVSNVFWFDDGGTFRATATGSWATDDGDFGGITARIAIFGERGQVIERGNYALTDSDVRKADTATLKLEFEGKALDVTPGTLVLRTIEGNVDATAPEEKLRKLSLSFEGAYSQRDQEEPQAIEGEIVFNRQ